MQDELKKLTEENQALKQDQEADMMKIQTQSQVKAAELELKQQNMQAEFALKRESQEQEMQLAREKALAEITLEREIAAMKLALEQEMNAANSDADIDAAIAKIQTLVSVHETKMQGMAKPDGDGAAMADDGGDTSQAMQQNFMEAVNAIVEKLSAKKTVSMKMPDGRVATATIN